MSVAYAYRAARGDGHFIDGVVEAESLTGATVALRARGLTALSLEPTTSPRTRRAAPRQALALAFRSLATLLQAGVPLDRAVLATLPVTEGMLRRSLEAARDGLGRGETLAQSLAHVPGVVPTATLAMLTAGERAGRLDDALEQVAQQLEFEAELRGATRQAMAYPLMLALVGMASLTIIVAVVLPRFAVLLADLGQELPPSTRALLGLSTLLQRVGVPVFALAALFGIVGYRHTRGGAGRLRWHAVLLAMPLVGPLRRSLASARTLQALASALGAGMPVVPALAVARDACNDAALGLRVSRARERVLSGSTLTDAFRTEGGLESLGLQLIAVGEASGQLGAMAGRGGLLVRRAAERQLRSAIGLLEPAMILLFGGLIAFVAAALLQAVYSLRPAA
jgi:type II secretory pathway component PulF